MARKIKPPEELPSKAWLMSFGDTMTTLLAFFIVLCSMAEDQSGANLHRGTGSFIKTMGAGGMNGAFSAGNSARAIQLQATSPLYMTDAEEEFEKGKNKGPDEDSNDIASKDREQEEFMRCLNELERQANLDAKPSTLGETTFDFFEKLNPQPPHLPPSYAKLTTRIIPFLRKATHRVELIVWAPTPSPTARRRTAIQSDAIVSGIVASAGLTPEAAERILGVSRTWPYTDVKRPIISVVIRRVSEG